jgi:peptide/nickel transport system substrate-binding protein
MNEAGWVMNKQTGIREKDGKPLKFDLSDLVDKRRGEFFQAKMREIGIDVDVRIVTSDILWQITRQAGTYAMASTWFTYGDPDVLRLLYHSSNIGTGFAISRYRNSQLDEKLINALGERDSEGRKQLYFDLQKEIMSQALIVPVYSRRQYDGLKANIQGYRLDRGEYPVLYDVNFK